jgi:hypothetical protein
VLLRAGERCQLSLPQEKKKKKDKKDAEEDADESGR